MGGATGDAGRWLFTLKHSWPEPGQATEEGLGKIARKLSGEWLERDEGEGQGARGRSKNARRGGGEVGYALENTRRALTNAKR